MGYINNPHTEDPITPYLYETHICPNCMDAAGDDGTYLNENQDKCQNFGDTLPKHTCRIDEDMNWLDGCWCACRL